MRSLWASWYNDNYYKLILLMRKLKFGEITIKFHEGIPVDVMIVQKKIVLNKINESQVNDIATD